ncbi:SA1362 family protein [Anoxybacillus sp. J5B_2022]|uniref:SA1362 family protein n=1 Tax=Anoxybacillus sp. J5B_2022 TaxID=3003246 RepID=UPI00228550FA|nr:SA1362 family protein [Anoxybacillus sp. J5B_2022]MCZ0754657.1 hypothetical protein [Anoxybacillus sp. J5B_2022]
MFRRTTHPLIGIVLFLGAFGLVYTLFAQPALLFRRIIFIGLIVALLYAIYYFVYQRRMDKERAAYLKAVQQSKKRHVERGKVPAKLSHSKKGTHHRLPKKRSTTHLTVIEGKKGKKKNRASF